MTRKTYRFDFAISFAGADRAVAKQLRDKLKRAGYSVFYDRDFEHEMLGLDGAEYLRNVYSHECRYCIVLISAEYDRREWTRLERESLQSRELQGERGFLLPVIIDGHHPTWLPATRVYFDLENRSLDELLQILAQRKPSPRPVSSFWDEMPQGAPSRADLVRSVNAPKFLAAKPGTVVRIPASGSYPESFHIFNENGIHAVNTALATRRPLLIAGEPGIGKRYLAPATASLLHRVFISFKMTARTEPGDLIWTVDKESRLADAQLLGAMARVEEGIDRIDINRYLHPGPMWWALDWDSAAQQAAKVDDGPPAIPSGVSPQDGCVLQIESIDRGNDDVLFGIIEILESGTFLPPRSSRAINTRGVMPLTVITTTSERKLPEAFTRQCLLLRMALPEDKQELIEWLVQNGSIRFPSASKQLMVQAAELIAEDRTILLYQQNRVAAVPGLMEYLDLVRAVIEVSPDENEQTRRLFEIAEHVIRKESDSFDNNRETPYIVRKPAAPPINVGELVPRDAGEDNSSEAPQKTASMIQKRHPRKPSN